jgi:iron(III) transport system substrate-binding protein
MVLRFRLLFVLLALALGVGGLAACQPSPTTVEAEPDPVLGAVEAEPDPVPDPVAPGAQVEPGANGRLVIYSGRSESLVQPLIDRFAAETGIAVDVRYGSTAEMAGVLLEEGDNSPADVFYAQDPGGLGAVQAAGLLAPLPAELSADVPARFKSAVNDWVGISGRARVVAYNTDAITDPAAELPTDIYEFVDPQWDGRLAWAPTNSSFQAMVTAMRHEWGDDRTRDWLAGIQANNPLVFDGNTPIVAAVGAGEADAGFVNHYYLYRFLSEQGETFPARNYFLPGGGPGSLIMVSGAGVLGSAENRANAEQFIAYLLSPEGQAYFTNETFEYPVIDGVALPEGLPPFAELDTLADDIALGDLADLQGTLDMLIDVGIIE